MPFFYSGQHPGPLYTYERLQEIRNTSPPPGWPFREIYRINGLCTSSPPPAAVRWLLGDLRLPSSQSASFPNKVVSLASTPHLIYWPVVLQAKRASAQFSRSVVSKSLQAHGWQHTRPPCPSLTPGVHPDSCPLSRWCHPAMSSSVELRLGKNIRGSNTPCVVVVPKGKGAPKKTSLGPWDGQVWTSFHRLPNKCLHVWLNLAGELPSLNPGAKLWWNNPHLSWIFQQPLWSSK